jgi:hypothetical protein
LAESLPSLQRRPWQRLLFSDEDFPAMRFFIAKDNQLVRMKLLNIIIAMIVFGVVFYIGRYLLEFNDLELTFIGGWVVLLWHIDNKHADTKENLRLIEGRQNMMSAELATAILAMNQKLDTISVQLTNLDQFPAGGDTDVTGNQTRDGSI